MLNYLRKKYIGECVATIGTIGSRNDKTAINDANRNLMNDRLDDMSQTDLTDLGKNYRAAFLTSAKIQSRSWKKPESLLA